MPSIYYTLTAATSAHPENEPSLFSKCTGWLFHHALLLLLLAGPGAAWTALNPLSVTHFTRTPGQGVSVSTRHQLLFLIPFRTADLQRVTAVTGDSIAGDWQRRADQITTHRRTEDTGYLFIQHAQGEYALEVSPWNLPGVQARAGNFLADPAATHLRLFTVTNWKFGVFAGGLLSLPAVLYLWLLLRAFRRLLPARFAAPRLYASQIII